MIESIQEFYQRIIRDVEKSHIAYDRSGEYFDVQASKCNVGKTSFSYRNFYKVALVTHTGKLFYADKWIDVDRPAILFSTPLIPYAWEAISVGIGDGDFCIFNEAFLRSSDRNGILADSPLLDISKERIYFIDEDTVDNVRALFLKIRGELKNDYPGRGDILRCYVHLLVHEAMKMQETSSYIPQKNAGQRTAELFLALLERQFPIDIPNKNLSLRTANDFAERLSVHVNYLNRVVKASTGRTTSTLLNNRIVQEALQMLQHSSYTISEIAFALGFEETASFSNFIKKHTDLSPSAHRAIQTV